ncbi:hypothetical protein O181_105482 [Austropuccinia psidii MF-1]|uniref:Chromo domain-containing protein n=1 Tax=Austropuccinia psidii MF-1 TaxID=1389203 RepID=A0A9Q3JNL3_9BASI|nr:hypothetical protein [Austropuccinia psidii MF-1]
MEPDFKEGDHVLVSILNFNNLKGPKKMGDSFETPSLSSEFSQAYIQTEEDKFPSTKKNPTPPEIVGVEDSPAPVKKIIKARKIRFNGKDQRQYLVRFKNQTADKAKWLEEDAIPEGNLYLRKFRASKRTEQSHQ